MAKLKKAIQLRADDRKALVELYLQRCIAVDQYESRAAELEELAETWRTLTGRSDLTGDIFHYMRSQRKQGKWPKLEDKCLPVPPRPYFTADESEILIAVYTEYIAKMGAGSDSISYDDAAKAFIVKEYAHRAGRMVPFENLMTKLTALRKRGLLTKVSEVPPPPKDDDAVGPGESEAV